MRASMPRRSPYVIKVYDANTKEVLLTRGDHAFSLTVREESTAEEVAPGAIAATFGPWPQYELAGLGETLVESWVKACFVGSRIVRLETSAHVLTERPDVPGVFEATPPIVHQGSPRNDVTICIDNLVPVFYTSAMEVDHAAMRKRACGFALRDAAKKTCE